MKPPQRRRRASPGQMYDDSVDRKYCGQMLRQCLAQQHLSLRDVAPRIGVSPAAISKQLNGDVWLHHTALLHLADLLGLSPQLLYAPRAQTTLGRVTIQLARAGAEVQEAIATFLHATNLAPAVPEPPRRATPTAPPTHSCREAV